MQPHSDISQTWCSLMQLFVDLVPIPYRRQKEKIKDENHEVRRILQTFVPISSQRQKPFVPITSSIHNVEHLCYITQIYLYFILPCHLCYIRPILHNSCNLLLCSIYATSLYSIYPVLQQYSLNKYISFPQYFINLVIHYSSL